MNIMFINVYDMTFINKSANYAQTVLLKTNYIAPLLVDYNRFLVQVQNDISIKMSYDYYIVPNNNIKYYLYITKKSVLERSKDDQYNILYFFPDSDSVQSVSENKSQAYSISDFFVEIDNVFSDNMLLEGYLYKRNNKFTFLISDILIQNGDVVTCDYALRHTLVNELILNKHTTNMNNHLSIGIHPIYHCNNERMLPVFMNNFIFSSDIKSIEHISNFKKVRQRTYLYDDKENLKIIEKGKYIDVFNVYSSITGNSEGILYIKGMYESKAMKAIFKENTQNQAINCIFNNDFNKWQPVLT